MTSKYDIMHSLVPLVNHYNFTLEEGYNQFKITFQRCYVFVTFLGSSVELLYITFLRSVISTIGLYLEDTAPENFYFQYPDRNKVQCINQRLLKEVNGDHKCLRCPCI